MSTDDVATQPALGSGRKLRRFDSLDIESGRPYPRHTGSTEGVGWKILLQLTFQGIGIVYGDIGTSPMYVMAGIFSDGIKNNDDVIGALSLIFYTLTLIPLIKYVFIVLRANDHGEGGTFAMYSLICRHAKIGLIPSQDSGDGVELEVPDNGGSKRESKIKSLLGSSDLGKHVLWFGQLCGLVSNQEFDDGRGSKRASKVKLMLENSNFAKYVLLFATMLGTAMVIGDGIITPCISVTSAVNGLKQATSRVTDDVIVWTSVAILVLLFMFQRFGTDKVGYCFAPVLLFWFVSIAGNGIFNFIKHDPSVIRALDPMYIVHYFARNKKRAWLSLGGVVLCITGCEALFADVGHFSVRSIQISMCSVIYPSIVLAYFGQASFLRKHNDLVSDAFYASIPEKVYWPMFVVAVLAAIIASQSLISGTFSIVQQSTALGCFPRVKVVHTSAKHPGQVYIPEVNYILMLACVFLTLVLRTSSDMGNAYGIVVVFVMTLTSAFLVLIMILIWKTNILLVIAYVVLVLSVELVYLSSVLAKFTQGGYLPLAFALVLMAIMFVWNNVYRRKYYFEAENKIAPETIKEIIQETNSHRLRGMAIFYSDSESIIGIPPIFKHHVANVPALHSLLVFVSFKFLPIAKVLAAEKLVFRRVQPAELGVFRCVVRCGYKDDVVEREEPLEQLLYEKLKEFVGREGGGGDVAEVEEAWRGGVVHLIGEHEVVAGKGAGVWRRVVIGGYNFMEKNLRRTNKLLDIPHQRMLKVGMIVDL